MRKGWAAVILQWPEHRIGVDLIAGPNEKTACVIVADVVTAGGNRAVAAGNILSRRAPLQDGVPNLERGRSTSSPGNGDSAAVQRTFISSQRAVVDYYRSRLIAGETDNASAGEFSKIAAQGAVIDGECSSVCDSAAVIASGVTADGAILDSKRVSRRKPIGDPAAAQVCGISADRAVDHRER